jgi:hypothetical protein
MGKKTPDCEVHQIAAAVAVFYNTLSHTERNATPPASTRLGGDGDQNRASAKENEKNGKTRKTARADLIHRGSSRRQQARERRAVVESSRGGA